MGLQEGAMASGKANSQSSRRGVVGEAQGDSDGCAAGQWGLWRLFFGKTDC